MRFALTTLVIALLLAGCGEKEESTAPPSSSGASSEPPPADQGDEADGPGDTNGGGQGEPTQSPQELARQRERQAERVVRSYMNALDARDGAAVCRLLAPGVEDELKLPRERSDCAGSLDASIGYRDPRGLPQFEGVSIAGIAGVKASAREARVTATVVTSFGDRAEPSIEDDVIYLIRRGGEYVVAQPSAALYRAIGAEPPLRSIVPPS